MTMSLNIALLNRSLNLIDRPASLATPWIPFTAKKKAENCTPTTISVEQSEGTVTAHRHIYREERKADEGEGVSPLGALRPVSEGEHEAHEEEADVGILEDGVDDFDALAADDSRVLQRVAQDEERDEEISLDDA